MPGSSRSTSPGVGAIFPIRSRTPDEVEDVHDKEMDDKKWEGEGLAEIRQRTQDSAKNTAGYFFLVIIAENDTEVIYNEA